MKKAMKAAAAAPARQAKAAAIVKRTAMKKTMKAAEKAQAKQARAAAPDKGAAMKAVEAAQAKQAEATTPDKGAATDNAVDLPTRWRTPAHHVSEDSSDYDARFDHVLDMDSDYEDDEFVPGHCCHDEPEPEPSAEFSPSEYFANHDSDIEIAMNSDDDPAL